MKSNIAFINTVKAYFAKNMSVAGKDKTKMISYFYIALTLFTVSFFGFFAITPTLNTISNLNKQYEDNNLVYESLKSKLADLKSLDQQYNKIQPDIDSIYRAIPKTTEIPTLTRQVENIAATSNVDLTKFTVANVEIYPNIKNNPIYSYAFTVDVDGSQDNVNSFIGNMINFDRIIGIDRVTTGHDQKNQFTASITGRAFFINK